MVKLGDRLRAFRERQIEFGKQSRKRAIAREGQKLEFQKVRTERRLSEAKERTAIAIVKQKEVRNRNQARASSIFSGLSGGGSGIRTAPRARQDFFGTGGGSLDSDPLGIRIGKSPAPTRPAVVARRAPTRRKVRRRKSRL